MNRAFIEIPSFRDDWENLGLNDDDFRRLQSILLADPKIGGGTARNGRRSENAFCV